MFFYFINGFQLITNSFICFFHSQADSPVYLGLYFVNHCFHILFNGSQNHFIFFDIQFSLYFSFYVYNEYWAPAGTPTGTDTIMVYNALAIILRISIYFLPSAKIHFIFDVANFFSTKK